MCVINIHNKQIHCNKNQIHSFLGLKWERNREYLLMSTGFLEDDETVIKLDRYDVYMTLWLYWKSLNAYLKSVHFLTCELNIYLPYDPAILLLDCHAKEKKVSWPSICEFHICGFNQPQIKNIWGKTCLSWTCTVFSYHYFLYNIV